jgi:hypothetical protein
MTETSNGAKPRFSLANLHLTVAAVAAALARGNGAPEYAK